MGSEMEKEFQIVDKDIEESEKIYRPSMTYWQDAMRRFKGNRVNMFFFTLLAVLFFFSIFGPYLNKYDYRVMNPEYQFKFGLEAIKNGHYFGTDEFGRDVFTRTWEGGRISLSIALVVVILEGIIGTIYGGVAGFFGGKIDFVMMRIVEIFMAIPSMIYIILLMVALGPGIHTIIIAMGFTRWMIMAMIVRGEVLKIKEQEYVMASIVLGGSPFWIILKHLLPNAMGQIIVRLTMDIPVAIFTEAFLSFIGIGVPAPMASWGSLANDGYNLLARGPHLFAVPAILISLTTLSFNVVGDGLRDALDPKLRT